MTIYEIKRRTADTSPYFFCPETLRFFRQTMRSFKVRKQPDGRYRISAPMPHGQTVRFFNPENNELETE